MIIPKGWKLVPVEPTDDQLMAALRVQGDQINYDSVYVAMLAAAPTEDIPQVTAYDHSIPVAVTSTDDPKLNTPQPPGNACTNCWGTEVDAAGNPCPHPEWKRPIAPAGEPRQEDVEIPGDDGLDIHAPEQPVSDPDGLTEPGRREAEQAYINCAFDYARDPIGSRDWFLFWNGWRARNAAPAPDERERAALREDAERYRWLREKDNFPGDEGDGETLWDQLCDLECDEFDAMIDRLRAGKEGEQS